MRWVVLAAITTTGCHVCKDGGPPAAAQATLAATARTDQGMLVIDYQLTNVGDGALAAFVHPARPFPPPPTPADGVSVVFSSSDEVVIALAPELTPELATLELLNRRPAPPPVYSGVARLEPGAVKRGTVRVPLPLAYTTNDDVDQRPLAKPTTPVTIRVLRFELAYAAWPHVEVVDAYVLGDSRYYRVDFDAAKLAYAHADAEISLAAELPPPAFLRRRTPTSEPDAGATRTR